MNNLFIMIQLACIALLLTLIHDAVLKDTGRIVAAIERNCEVDSRCYHVLP